jgi:TolA-binding protein
MSIEPSDADLDLERSLLEAARREAPPARAETERAWRRFAASGGRVTASVAGGASRAWLSGANLAWLGAGLVAGSLATAAVMLGRDAAPEPAVPSGERAPGPAHEANPAPVAVPPATQAAVPLDGVPPAPPTASLRTEPAAAPGTPGLAAPKRAARKPRTARAAATPGLEAEVRALDAIRRAMSEGRPGDALDAVEVFHREFPRAQLAADAEGLAIEALLARGDTGAAAERAARFLVRYPSDPHAPRFAPLAGDAR